jgi:hypothetical protein
VAVQNGAEQNGFDPRGILAGLARNSVSYVLIGALARVIRGTNELTDGVDVCPSLSDFSRERLGEALDDLQAQRADRRRLVLEEALATEPVIRLRTALGELKLVPEPAGTRRGYNDLRRAATREHLGDGVRPDVASVADLARMSAALAHELATEHGRDADRAREHAIESSRELRRIMELEHGLQRTLGLERGMGRDRGIDI